MTVVFLICPGSLGARQTLRICIDKARRSVCITGIEIRYYSHWIRVLLRQGSPSNQQDWNTIKASLHILLHAIHARSLGAVSIFEFWSSPVLLYEVQFTVVFRIKVTNVAPSGDQFFECWFLVFEVWLCEKKSPTATISLSRFTFEPFALCIQTSQWPQTSFFYYLLFVFTTAGV